MPYERRRRPPPLARTLPLGTSERHLLRRAVTCFTLSAHGYDRVRRVARTIADLEDASRVPTTHLAEALEYRGRGDR